MRYSHVTLQSIGYELAPHVVTSDSLEARLAPVYAALRLPTGQIAALTGVRERRFWDAGQGMADGAARAGRKALTAAGLVPEDIGMLVYGGVCRDNLEPATACATADTLGIRGTAVVHDTCNACLGVMNAILQVANAIELGQIEAGLVVSCESAREIVESTIARMVANPTMEMFKRSMATMTGGSGAIGIVLTHTARAVSGHRLVGGVVRAAPEHHALSRWGAEADGSVEHAIVMETDAVGTLRHGVALGASAFEGFVGELGWTDGPDRVICHQVGAPHRAAVLAAMNIPLDRDFSTFEYLGNIGTVSVPITAAIADERGALARGQRVGFFGIGSGLNCLLLGLEW
ncbi:MAG: 3-oxoacyl-ACP synthase III [Acidobacteria bacterium]|nr:3-oxoacyl-ACP synthase III [Acidobacteriota bacterium]